jgi:hypothetical protein
MGTQDRNVALLDIDDLSQAIFAWLDTRPRGLIRRTASPNWSPRELRDSFRTNLERALRGAVVAARLVDVIAYLVDAFTVEPSGGLIGTSKWSMELYNGSDSGTLSAMRHDVAQLIKGERRGNPVPSLTPDKYAELIVSALDASLQAEASRIPMNGTTSEDVLRHYLISDDIRRALNVRLFLFFVGLAVCMMPIYAFLAPDSWLNPGTALFALLAYVTLIVTAAAHELSSAGPR